MAEIVPYLIELKPERLRLRNPHKLVLEMRIVAGCFKSEVEAISKVHPEPLRLSRIFDDRHHSRLYYQSLSDLRERLTGQGSTKQRLA